MPIVRVRQHVNPLSLKYQTPPAVPLWEQVYANLSQPLHLDIGCARGQFLLAMAQQQPDWNFWGWRFGNRSWFRPISSGTNWG